MSRRFVLVALAVMLLAVGCGSGEEKTQSHGATDEELLIARMLYVIQETERFNVMAESDSYSLEEKANASKRILRLCRELETDIKLYNKRHPDAQIDWPEIDYSEFGIR